VTRERREDEGLRFEVGGKRIEAEGWRRDIAGG